MNQRKYEETLPLQQENAKGENGPKVLTSTRGYWLLLLVSWWVGGLSTEHLDRQKQNCCVKNQGSYKLWVAKFQMFPRLFQTRLVLKMPVPKLKPSLIPLNRLHKSWKRRLLTSDQDMEVY